MNNNDILHPTTKQYLQLAGYDRVLGRLTEDYSFNTTLELLAVIANDRIAECDTTDGAEDAVALVAIRDLLVKAAKTIQTKGWE